MKFLITFIAGSLIGYVIASFLLNTESRLTTGALVPGIPDSSLVQGETVEKVQEKTFEGHVTLQRSEVSPAAAGQKSETMNDSMTNDIFSSFEKIIPLDSLESPMSFVSLAIKTYPPADSIDLSWFANIKERTFERVDTLFVTRTDTLTITKAIEQPRAFYDNFWGGATVVALLVYLASLVIN